MKRADQLEAALTAGVEELCKALHCEEGAIWMLDEQSGNLVAVSAAGPVDYCGMSAKAGHGILGRVVAENKPARIGSLENGIPLLSDEDTTNQPL